MFGSVNMAIPDGPPLEGAPPTEPTQPEPSEPAEADDFLGWDETDDVDGIDKIEALEELEELQAVLEDLDDDSATDQTEHVDVVVVPTPDPEAHDSICEEKEKLLHDDATNLGRGEAWLADELTRQGCPPRLANKRTTNAVLYGEYPYAGNARGYILRRVPYWWNDPTGARLFSGQVSLEGGYARGGVWGAAGHLRGSLWRVGVETSHAYHDDRYGKTELYYGDVHFVTAPVLRERAVWWVGVGAAWSDQAAAEDIRVRGAGLSGTTSVDVFPIRPLVLSARITAGRRRGADEIAAHVLSGRLTGGLMLRRFELYGGYEAKRVGIRSLHGPVLGARTWF